jgi:hypothetical protein
MNERVIGVPFNRVGGEDTTHPSPLPPGRSTAMTDEIDGILDRVLRSPFRARQRLGPRERGYLEEKGMPAVIGEARRLLLDRLAVVEPSDDGRQTPMRGHPAFIAQHATATCCRGCLDRHYGIPSGRPLNDAELDLVIALVERWLRRQAPDIGRGQTDLFDR